MLLLAGGALLLGSTRQSELLVVTLREGEDFALQYTDMARNLHYRWWIDERVSAGFLSANATYGVLMTFGNDAAIDLRVADIHRQTSTTVDVNGMDFRQFRWAWMENREDRFFFGQRDQFAYVMDLQTLHITETSEDQLFRARDVLREAGLQAEYRVLATQFGTLEELQLSPDKAWLAFRAEDGVMYVQHRPSRKVYSLHTPFGEQGQRVEWVSWSPDGGRLLYAVNFAPSEGIANGVYLSDLTGGNPQRIAANGISAWWSGSGQYVAIFELHPVQRRVNGFYLIAVDDPDPNPPFFDGVKLSWEGERLTYIYSKANRQRLMVLWPGEDGRAITGDLAAVYDFAYRR